MSDVKGLIADARGYAKADAGYSKALLEDLADALEAATVERAVVEAQALEQAADALFSISTNKGERDSASWLRARAVEIREGRQ